LFAQAAGTGFGRAKLDLADIRMRRGQGTSDENARTASEELINQFQRALARAPH
jgi:hypothetical protein